MLRVTTVVIGAGHSGLAVSRHLAERGIDHVVLERGEVASSWRTQRWDSLRLLTPNWLSRLPGYGYRGDDPDGYMSAPEVTAFIEAYAKEIAAPVRAHTTVTAVRRTDDGYVVETDQETWRARTVVVAAGGATVPSMPQVRESVPGGIEHRTPAGSTRALPGYRNPADLPDGGVLVVGPSASGIQIAQEVHASGRPVTLAVGEHVRMPRTYRGRDVLWWMDATGLFDERYDEIPDLLRARVLPSMQLIGSPERATLDLNTLTRAGVRLVGRLVGRARRGGAAVRLAAQRLHARRPQAEAAAHRFRRVGGDGRGRADGRAARRRAGAADRRPRTDPARSSTCAAARSARSSGPPASSPDFGFLVRPGDLPVFDRKGRVRHDGGVVTASPGLYVIGLPFLRRRKSTLIDGAGPDAADIASHLVAHLAAVAGDRGVR